MKFGFVVTVAVLSLGVSSVALADEGAPADADVSAKTPETKLTYPRVGGHIGVAVPYLNVSSDTKLIGQRKFLTIANPIGITGKLSDKWAVDFEVIIANSVLTSSVTQLTVDPGIIYNWGPVATGMRVAYAVGDKANVGVIPLVNKGFPVGSVTWFVEAAFPTNVKDGEVAFNAVLHTGFGF